MPISSIFSRNAFSMSPREVQQAIEKGGQAASYILGNQTEAIQTITNRVVGLSKTAMMMDNGKKISQNASKRAKDYAKGDVLCTGLCVTAGICESASAAVLWVPFPGKVATLATLKTVSTGCLKFRDFCAADLSNPFC